MRCPWCRTPQAAGVVFVSAVLDTWLSEGAVTHSAAEHGFAGAEAQAVLVKRVLCSSACTSCCSFCGNQSVERERVLRNLFPVIPTVQSGSGEQEGKQSDFATPDSGSPPATHSLTHARPLAQTLTHSRTHSLTHPPTHSHLAPAHLRILIPVPRSLTTAYVSISTFRCPQLLLARCFPRQEAAQDQVKIHC